MLVGRRLIDHAQGDASARERAIDPPEIWSPLVSVLRAAIDELIAGRLVVGLADCLHAEVRARLLVADAARRGGPRWKA